MEIDWIVPQAIDYLSRIVKKDHRILEIGGGNSTLWFARTGGKVLTVDHSKNRIDELKELMEKEELENVSFICSPKYEKSGI